METNVNPIDHYDMKEIFDDKGEFKEWDFKPKYVRETPEEVIDDLNQRWSEWKTTPQYSYNAEGFMYAIVASSNTGDTNE